MYALSSNVMKTKDLHVEVKRIIIKMTFVLWYFAIVTFFTHPVVTNLI